MTHSETVPTAFGIFDSVSQDVSVLSRLAFCDCVLTGVAGVILFRLRVSEVLDSNVAVDIALWWLEEGV